MTQYYLHGWMASEKTENNKKFFEDFLKDYKPKNKILCIAFAKIDKIFTNGMFQKMVNNFVDIQIHSELANNSSQILLEQIKSSKYIYITWWDYNSLLNNMIFLKDHKKIFQWKIIAWSSAWTNILSEVSFSNDYQSITQWIWLLNIWTMCHYDKKSIWREMLENLSVDLELKFIEEWKYIVIENS